MRRLAGQFKPLNLTIAAVLLLMAAGGFLWRSNQMSAVKLAAERPPGPTAFVYDYAKILTTPPTELNLSLQRLQQTQNIETIIVTFGKKPDGMPLAQLARKLIDNWQIGETYQERGLLLLIAAEGRKMQIGVRAGLTEIFTDTFCRHIQDWRWRPILDAGETYAALLKVVAEIETRAQQTRSGDFTSADIQRFDHDLRPGPSKK